MTWCTTSFYVSGVDIDIEENVFFNRLIIVGNNWTHSACSNINFVFVFYIMSYKNVLVDMLKVEWFLMINANIQIVQIDVTIDSRQIFPEESKNMVMCRFPYRCNKVVVNLKYFDFLYFSCMLFNMCMNHYELYTITKQHQCWQCSGCS